MKVKLISRHGQAVLIEYQYEGAAQRGYLPAVSIYRVDGRQYEASQYEADRPQLAAPFGLPLAELVTLTATPESIEAALHQYGIWTVDDIERNYPQVVAAFQSVLARDVLDLMRAARAYQSAADKSRGA